MELRKVDLSKFADPVLEDIMSRQDEIMQNMINDLVRQKDDVFKSALVRNGVTSNDIEFLKQNITEVVFNEYDEYRHYYYKFGTPEEKRIISIEKFPKFDRNFNEEVLSTRINYTQSYY